MKENREIGSEFWAVPIQKRTNNIIPRKAIYFISGTAALFYILNDICFDSSIKRVALPSWCCSCMIIPFEKRHIETVFYPIYINEEKILTCDYSNAKGCDITLVMSYFGYKEMNTISEPSGIIIRDVTHSLFSGKTEAADYYFGSLRKWAGFYTGGYAWKKDAWNSKQIIPEVNTTYVNARKSAMEVKKQYLNGTIKDKQHLALFYQAEEYLDQCDIESGTERDTKFANHLDVKTIKRKRRENAETLLHYISDVALFPHINEEDCPLFVPIILPNERRDLLKQHLISRNIYCPVHWPISSLHKLDEQTKAIYDMELSIICDQRYNIDDMKYIVDEINNSGII